MYKHGIYIDENDTPIVPPKKSSTVQVIVGTAPVNLAASISVNEPVLIFSYAEAISKLGYSTDYSKFSLCQSMDATFKVFNVAPIIMINVLDPAVHKIDVAAKAVNVVEKIVVEEVEGILKNTVVVKDSGEATTYVLDTDYTIKFNGAGHLEITLLTDGAAAAEATLAIDYTNLDPSKVTDTEIKGAFDVATNKYTGIEVIRQIYPRLNIVPGILIAPGHTHKPEVARALEVMNKGLNGSFGSIVLNDLLATEKDYTKIPEWKNDNGYTAKGTIALFPKQKIGSKVYCYSALLAALMAEMDADNEGVPYKSPSNKTLPVTAAVLDDGTELYLDQAQANFLNSHGIVTSVNIAGWRVWGNNTAVYPGITDPKDRFIAARRMFDYVGNGFVLSYFGKVDDPTSFRLIESVVDSENLKLNALQAEGKITSGSIQFRMDDNPITDLLDGSIKFLTMLSAGIPAKDMTNVLEFDPNGFAASLGGN